MVWGLEGVIQGLGHPLIIRVVTAHDTIGMHLAEGARALAQGSTTPRLDAELLLAHLLGVSRPWLLAHADEALDAAQYRQLIERRAGGEPLAYIVGFKDFWTLCLIVTPAVLVPRPETELLVERALTLIAPPRHPGESRGPVKSALDLGTGSGAIALALASERPEWQIAATDISAEALAVARANAIELEATHVELLQGCWFEPVAGRRFDLIVSNPPYIAADDAALLHPALKSEPPAALCPGADGMAALRAIIREAPHHLERNGWVVLEHGATQADDVARELVLQGFRHVTSRRDLAGHERITEAQWV
jgi:release factor glutamine methyltransferase